MNMIMRYKQLIAEGMPAIPAWNNIANQGEITTGVGENGSQPNYMTDLEVFPDATEEEADECFLLLQKHLKDLKDEK